MIETPAQADANYPLDTLAPYRFHTGATLRPLARDEPCPVLFRDIGPAATAVFLRGNLGRLAGPLSPITYMRTHEYQEPYTDYEQIGRLIILRPLELHVWHSGCANIYVASASRRTLTDSVGYVPGAIPLERAAAMACDCRSVQELREVFGGAEYDDAAEEGAHRLSGLCEELEQAEQAAAPLREMLQSPNTERRHQAREMMKDLEISEDDLCAAWHHVPRDRRDRLRQALEGK